MKRFVLHKADDITKVGSYLRSIDYKRPMVVEIKLFVKSKTSEQRAWFHTLCTMLGNELGYTMGEIKEIVKKHTLGSKEVLVGDLSFEVTASSESLKREGYSQLIESVYQLAAQAGIVLPNPYARDF